MDRDWQRWLAWLEEQRSRGLGSEHALHCIHFLFAKRIRDAVHKEATIAGFATRTQKDEPVLKTRAAVIHTM